MKKYFEKNLSKRNLFCNFQKINPSRINAGACQLLIMCVYGTMFFSSCLCYVELFKRLLKDTEESDYVPFLKRWARSMKESEEG